MAVALAPRIIVDPSIRFGKPVIKETRVPVDLIVAKVAGGTGLDDVAEEYGILDFGQMYPVGGMNLETQFLSSLVGQITLFKTPFGALTLS